MIEQDEQRMTEQEEQEERREELTDEIEYLTEEIDRHIALLVSGTQEIEDMDAEREGRPFRAMYAEVSERTGWSLELRSETFSLERPGRGFWQEMPLMAAMGLVERYEPPASGTPTADPPYDGGGA